MNSKDLEERERDNPGHKYPSCFPPSTSSWFRNSKISGKEIEIRDGESQQRMKIEMRMARGRYLCVFRAIRKIENGRE